MKIRCLIVDDEPLAIEVIESYLGRFNDVEIAASCNDAVCALDVLRKQKIDLLFLDIQMPHIKGTDFLRSLSHPPKVIFTTAYRDYALEGFELDVLDYLLKPISFERFMKAMNKYYQAAGKTETGVSISPSRDMRKGFINVKSSRKTVRVGLDEIMYIEGMKDYANIVTRGDTLTTGTALHVLEETLPAEYFLRIHRSYIVSIDNIDAFTNEYIEIGARQLPIGRHYKKQVLETLTN